MADFNAQSAAFMQWFTSIPGSTIHPSVSFKDYRTTGAGRGLVATAEIPTETVLFTIPRSAIMAVTTSDLSTKLPHLFPVPEDAEMAFSSSDADESADGPNPWSWLIFVMIYEYLRGAASPWAQYFNVLPTEFDTPMFWGREELAELQAGALAGRIGKEEAEEMFRGKIVPVVKENKAVFYPEGTRELADEEIVALAHRMGSTIMAYAFDLEGDNDEDEDMEEDGWVVDRDDRQALGMVPMADMMNADAEFNAHVNHAEDALTVISLHPISAGEEILNYYGPHPNSELLRKYGYVSERHSRYDVVEVPFTLIRKHIQAHLKLSDQFWDKAENFLDQDEIEESVVLERNSGFPGPDGFFQGPPTLDGTLDELTNQIFLVLKALRKVSAAVVPDKRKREEIASAVIPVILVERLAEYPTTVQEDVEIHKSLGEGERRKAMAVKVRMGEKKLLEEVLESLRGERGEREEPASK